MGFVSDKLNKFANVFREVRSKSVKLRAYLAFCSVAVLLASCVSDDVEKINLGTVKLQPADTIMLVTPYEGRRIQISEQGALYLKTPDFPPGLFVDYQIGHPQFGLMPGLAVDQERQQNDLRLLQENAVSTIYAADSLVYSTQKHKSTIFQAQWALHNSGMPAFNPERPIWEHYILHAPKLAKLIQRAYFAIEDVKQPSKPLANVDLDLLVRAKTADSLTEEEFNRWAKDTTLEKIVKAIRYGFEEDIQISDLVFAISEAAFWDYSHNAKFQELYHVRPDPQQFDSWAPNDLNLISERITFQVPRSRVGYETLTDRAKNVTVKDLKLPTKLFDINLERFAAYWSLKAEHGYFGLYDRAFLVTTLKAALRIDSDLGNSFRQKKYGSHEAFVRLIEQVQTNMANSFASSNEFEVDPVFGLLVREQLDQGGLKYVARILSSEAMTAQTPLLTRFYANLLARCTYICSGGTSFGQIRIDLAERLMSTYEKQIPAAPLAWKNQKVFSRMARLAPEVFRLIGQVERDPLESSWIVNELREGVEYSSAFLFVAEEPSLFVLHDVVEGHPRNPNRSTLAVSADFGPFHIRVDEQVSIQVAESSAAWGRKPPAVGPIGDTWNYHKRLLGAAFGGAQNIASRLTGAYQTQNVLAFANATETARLLEQSMGQRLFVEARVINDELNKLSDKINQVLINRQNGLFFPIDDARVLTTVAISEGGWVETEKHLLTYHPEFQYKIDLGVFDRNQNSYDKTELVPRGVYEGQLFCDGDLFFRSPDERARMLKALGPDNEIFKLAESISAHTFKADVFIRPSSNRKSLEEHITLDVNIPEEERYIKLGNIADDYKGKWNYQNTSMIKDGKLRLTSGLYWPGLTCNLVLR